VLSVVKAMTYSESRTNLDAAVNDREEVITARAGRKPAAIVALDEWESLRETAYLLQSPENARRLGASIARLEQGEGIERDLSE
jgi:antitoxin YefM